jgi:hypothetical protein
MVNLIQVLRAFLYHFREVIMPIKLREKKEDVEPFYPEGEDPTDADATCFLMKNMKPKEESKIEDGINKVTSDGEVKMATKTVTIELVEEKMVGVKNLLDAEGNEVKIGETHTVEDVLWLLPDKVEEQLYEKYGISGSAKDEDDDS